MPQNDSGKMLNVIAKSWTDADYKKKLLADPKGVLTSEGIDVPPQANVKVIDQQPNDMHVILPPKPAGDINVKDVGSHLAATTYLTFGGTADLTFFHAAGSGTEPTK